MLEVGARFAPALGFVNRPAIRVYNSTIERVWRPADSIFRRRVLQLLAERTTGLDNRLQSSSERIETQFDFKSNDTLIFNVRRTNEVLPTSFTLPDNILVPAGKYSWVRGQVELETADSRPLSLTLRAECCDYYLGRSTNTEIDLQYRPNATFGTGFKHELQVINQPSGHTTIHIESLNASIYFSPLSVLFAEFQYDNVSKRLGASIRYKWQIRPETDLFAALGESALLTGTPDRGSYHSQGTAIVLRVGHRLQY
jgi:hypothetical protein